MASAKQNAIGTALASGFIALYLRLVYATSRWTITNAALRDDLGKAPAIVVFWHARLAVMPYIFRHLRKSHMLISAHRDGELIARTVERLGFLSVRGSTARQKPGEEKAKDKGGAAALRRMIRIVKNGGAVGITPDGPRGPRMRVSPGTITLAALTGAPIIAVSSSSSRAIRFNSWDRFLLPLPFGHIRVAFDEPLILPEPLDDAAAAEARRTLEDRLNRLTEACDRAAGQEPVLPAPETKDQAKDSAPAEPSARTLEPSP
jgi:lysophospholipid acyltransferase (LPLAT)-like uncharacterized protein